MAGVMSSMAVRKHFSVLAVIFSNLCVLTCTSDNNMLVFVCTWTHWHDKLPKSEQL